jgi:predicted Zn-dependent peptidase
MIHSKVELNGIKRVELDNGLVLLMEETQNTKKTALLAGVRVGSVDETKKVNGGSHFNEHLLFKSNKYRSARAIAEDLEYSGTVINAYTTWKYTAFTAKTPCDHLNTAVEVIYQAATNYSYKKEEFATERQVILTEIENFINSPDRYSLTGLFIPKLFEGTPLEKKIEGTVDIMGAVTEEELAEFKQSYYVPNNMVITAVGKYDEAELISKVKELFGSLPEKKLPAREPAADLKNRKRKTVEERKDISQVYMCLGYKVPGYDSKDAHLLEMLSSLLSEGLSSRLYQELRDKRGIGYGVGSFYYPLDTEGMFLTHVEGFDPKRLDEAQEAIIGIFGDLKKNLVSDREFNGTKTLMLSKYDDSLERITDRAGMLLETEIYQIPYDYREKEKYIRDITKEQVREAAQTYLTDDYTLTLLQPEK